MHVIYGLEDPRDNLVFYVGMTNDLYSRFVQHIRCMDDNEEKNKRIHELQVLGLLRIPRTLEICHSTKNARLRELHWIGQYRQNLAPLANGKPGEVITKYRRAPRQPSIDQPCRYQMPDRDVDKFIAAYRACGNIDRALAGAGKGTHYREHARRVIEVYGLREEA